MPGRAQESRHNLVYWRYGDYAGIGPGAHGRLTLQRHKQATVPTVCPSAGWRREKAGHGEEPRETVGAEAQVVELLMMGLRLAEGVPLARTRTDQRPALARLASTRTASRVRSTQAGSRWRTGG